MQHSLLLTLLLAVLILLLARSTKGSRRILSSQSEHVGEFVSKGEAAAAAART